MKKKSVAAKKFKKRMRACVFAITLAFGVMYVPQQIFQTAPVTTTVTAASAKIKTVKVTKKETTKTFKSAKGTALFQGTYQKPVLNGSSTSIKKINTFYTTAQNKFFQDYKKQTTKTFSQEEDFIKEMGTPYSDALTADITYNKNGVISIMQTGYFYSGGAHGMPYRISHTFDLNTGKELKLTDIMKGSKTQIKNKIVDAFQKKLNNFEGAFDNAMTTVKKSADTNSPFYLQKNKITFYYGPYDLAPYAAGFVEASIPYTAKNTFKINLK